MVATGFFNVVTYIGFGFIALVTLGVFWIHRIHQRTKKNGLPLVATVLTATPTKHTSSKHPTVDLGLRVEIPDGRSYEVPITVPIHPLHAPRLQPGQVVPVRVDRNQPRRVLLDLDRPLPPSGEETS